MQQSEPRSWREILRKVIQDPKERRQLAQTLEIDARTLDRWAEGTSNPRAHNILPLIDALPTYRYALTKLIAEEFPDVAQRLETAELSIEETVPDISSVLYDRVIAERANASFSPLVRWSICTLVMQQFVNQLDSNRTGVAAILAQCVPPQTHETNVRSLREHFLEYSTAWTGTKRGVYFLGAESLAGAVTSTCQPQVYNDVKQEHFLLFHHTEDANSIAAYPVQSSGRVAGCLLAFGTQQNFFSKVRFDLVRQYSNLLSLAFQEQDFYRLEDIDFQIMPQAGVQLLFLSTFNERVNEVLSRSEHQHTSMKRSQAEQVVLQQFIEEGDIHDSESGADTPA